ncbi:MAG: DUF1573 domain-containing protein [Saprospiraceae bacterium]|nr:DUF1573 domain-containing protein [Saprospiraceae bacterium]
MRYIFTLLVLSISLQISSAQTSLEMMRFDEETYDLGPIKKGEKREFSYTFTNIGKEDIQIDLVSGCDCTTLDWTRLPIKPSGTGTIEVIFDSTEKEDSEPVDIDIYLKNINPKTGHPMLKIIDYSFQLVKE